MQRFHHLDTLRFFFALIVVLGHSMGWLKSFPLGGLAVDFFFVLSGFVLTHNIQTNQPSWSNFILARLARLYPLHFFTLCCLVFIYRFTGDYQQPDGLNGNIWVLNLLLLHNAGMVNGLLLNWPSWSISAEFITGLLLLYPIAKHQKTALTCGLALLFLTLLLQNTPDFDRAHTQPIGPVSAGLVRCAMGSLIGYLLYMLKKKINWPPIHTATATWLHGVLLLSIVYMLTRNPPTADYLLIPYLLMMVLIFSMATMESALTQLLSQKLLAACGALSYSIYMLHAPLLLIAQRSGYLTESDSPTLSVSTLQLGVFLAILLLLSIASYHLLEKPAKKLVMNLGKSFYFPRFNLWVWVGGMVILCTSFRAFHHFSHSGTATPRFYDEHIQLASGWHEKEEWGVWAANKAPLLLVDACQNNELRINVKASPSLVGQQVNIWRNDASLHSIMFRDGHIQEEIIIPVECKNGVMRLEFRYEKLSSPAQMHLSADIRKLGIGLENVSLQ